MVYGERPELLLCWLFAKFVSRPIIAWRAEGHKLDKTAKTCVTKNVSNLKASDYRTVHISTLLFLVVKLWWSYIKVW